MNEEENIPEEKPESINSKPSGTSVNPLPQDKVEPNISPSPSPLLEEEKNKTETTETYPPLQTSNMEVHHPHHLMHKKKWTEYLLEFFMLFLAVFLGFIAENIREHSVEKQRARQYASQLVSDLKIDSAQIDSSIVLNSMISKKLDTLRQLIDQQKNTSTGQLYYYGRFCTWYNRFTPNDATIQQMKSSGAIRYFHNPKVEKMISEYDRILRRLQIHETGEYGSLTEMWLLTGQIFRGDILDLLNEVDKPRQYYAVFMQNNYPLVSNDTILFLQLSNLCRARQLWIRYKIDESLKPALKTATQLIQQLEKAYK